jgi:hypothetical protein
MIPGKATEADMNTVVVDKQSMMSQMPAESDMEIAGDVNPARMHRLRAMVSGGGRTLLFFSAVALVILAGWSRRGNVYLSPEDGLGYALGIIGGVMMLTIFLYPLRKHKRWARILGGVREWFRAHMLMGVIAPVCILYHCNFQLGSMNGNVALFSMLLVASSGLVGRYFYTRIHYGLYGRKADLAHLGSDAAVLRKSMERIFVASPKLQHRLATLESQTMQLPHGFISSLGHVLYISFKSRWCGVISAIQMRRALEVIARHDHLEGNDLRKMSNASRFYLTTYLETIRRVAGLTFYERLFALWHVLHMPLFVMLVLSGVVHVFAVHVY